jgi:hypothetical protein
MVTPTHTANGNLCNTLVAGWVKANAAPAGEQLIKNLLAKGWIERRGLGNELSYRLADEDSNSPVESNSLPDAVGRPPLAIDSLLARPEAQLPHLPD